MKIAPGTRVQFRYRLFDTKGELVESTDDEPVSYVHGEEEILPGLERALDGREAGDELRVELGPEDAYGDYNPEGLVYVPRADLPEDLTLAAGEWIEVAVEDGPDEDAEMEMRVVEVHGDEVVLDANHPLAGQRVVFEVRVEAVARA